MKKIFLLTAVLALSYLTMFGQGAKNIKINEVLTNNTTNVVDEYGNHQAWIELANTSYTTYNVRGMFIATDTAVLNKNLLAPDRIKMMCPIPSNEPRTQLSARAHLLLFLNSSPNKGALHLSAQAKVGEPIWIGLYDGNGVDLIDSVSVPALNANTSYAREKDGADQWITAPYDAVTPNTSNYVTISESKVSQIKNKDPHGFGITLLSMGIVFTCLALLCIFFTIFGKIMHRQQKDKANAEKQERKLRHAMMEEDERAFPKVVEKKHFDDDNDVCIAVIAMAMKEYLDNIHDEESGIITIRSKHSNWTRA